MQHHFGGKDGILIAVVEDSFNHFAAGLDDLPVDGTSLEKRAALFVDRAWEHFRSPGYRSVFEILLNTLARDDLPESSNWQAEMFRAWDGIWMRIFHDAPISRRRHRVLEHYVIASLSGLASTLMLEGPEATLRREELDLLTETLFRELAPRAE